jgi:Tol biopolymer transport system component
MRQTSRRFAVAVSGIAAMTVFSISARELAAVSGVKRVMERVSVSSAGAQATLQFAGRPPALSSDGRFACFDHDATNLVTDDTNGVSDIFVRDRIGGITERASVSSDEVQGNGSSASPDISADGRFVVFESVAANLVTGDANGFSDIFVRDRQAGTTARVSIATGGAEANNASFEPAISANGRFVVFRSSATNLGAGADANSFEDIFVRDLQAGTTERVSVTNTGGESVGGGSFDPTISADGRFVAFVSLATNLVGTADTNALQDTFVRDRTAGTTERVSVTSAEVQTAGGVSTRPLITADGRFVVFQSGATNLVTDDTNAADDTFLRDRVAGTTERVSVSSDGVGGNAGSFQSAVSADGSVVAFLSAATNLAPGLPVVNTAVFVRNRLTGETLRADISATGDVANGAALSPAISGDGRYVGFTSAATNLVPGDTNGFLDVFVTSVVVVPGTRIAIFRPTTHQWFARDDDGTTSFVQFGGPGDLPAPADYLGLGRAQAAVYRPSTGQWFIRAEEGQTIGPIQLGGPGVEGLVPVPGDYLGTGRAQVAVFLPSAGAWGVRRDDGQLVAFLLGGPEDVPVPADYLGQGTVQPAVFRPSTREWFILNPQTLTAVAIQFGGPGDQPVPGDYFGLGRDSIAIFRPSSGEWFLRHGNGQTTRIPLGSAGDVPVPGDYLERGFDQIAVFRPSTRSWFIRDHAFRLIQIDYGGPGDLPLPVPFRPGF